MDVHPDASSLYELIYEALSAKFFLAQKIPLPLTTLTSLNFLMNCCPQAVSHFWADQLTALDALVREAQPVERRW